MRRPVTCRRCGKVIRQGQVMGVWILNNGVVRLHVRYQCPKCRFEGYATLPPEIWAGASLIWEMPFTEFTPEEAERFSHLPPITLDEVLDFHEQLKYIDRIPKALFERLSQQSSTRTKPALTGRNQKKLPQRGET